MALDSFRDLFMAELRDLYSAETQALKSLPQFIRGADTPALRKLLLRHKEQTEEQIRRLEASFAWLTASPRGRHSLAMEGLVAAYEESELARFHRRYEAQEPDRKPSDRGIVLSRWSSGRIALAPFTLEPAMWQWTSTPPGITT